MEADIFASRCLFLNSNNYGNILSKNPQLWILAHGGKKSENGVGELDNEERKFWRVHKL